jgi:amidase
LASGQVWLATGNDLGGSLRTPAAFNGVVGLRPGPGRVPRGERLQLFDSLWVEGPMARCVSDIALMLDAGAGYDPIDPLSFHTDPGTFVSAVQAPRAPRRVAFSPDLNAVPMAKEVAALCEKAALRFNGIGCEVTADIPDFSGAADAFQVLRGVLLGTMMGELLEQHRAQIAPEIIGNVELGQQVRIDQLFAAERFRWKLHQQMAGFFEHHDLLICPAVSIPPFPVEQRYVDRIDGQLLSSYIDWFSVTFILSLTACPVLSLPCGLTEEGLPVGIQLVGKPRGEVELLAAAALLEPLLGMAERLPIDPSGAHPA